MDTSPAGRGKTTGEVDVGREEKGCQEERVTLSATSETLGSAKASVLRRVTTTTFLHSGFLIRSCTMRPPTFPVAPSTIAEYCAFASAAAIVTSHAESKTPASPRASEGLLGRAISSHHFYCRTHFMMFGSFCFQKI